MKNNIKICGTLLLRCWRRLFVLDIVFKLLGSVVLFPACQLLFNKTLKLTKMYYIASQNYKTIGQYPLMVTVLVFILLVFIAFTAFEMNCLYICFASAWHDEPMRFDRLAWAGCRRTLGLFRPKNALLLIVAAAAVPGLSFFLFSSGNDYIKIRMCVASRSILKQPGFLIFCGIVVLLLLLLFIYPFAFISYTLCETEAVAAFRESRHLEHRYARKMVSGMVVIALLIAGICIVVVFGVDQGVKGIVYLFDKSNTARGQYLTIASYIKDTAYSIGASLIVFGVTSYVTAVFFERRVKAGDNLPQPVKTETDTRWKNKAFIVISSMLVAITILINTVTTVTVDRNAVTGELFGEKLTITAHRGDSEMAPENTLPAFEAAIADGADFVELDVRLTSDGIPVVMHDASCKRTCGVNRKISAMTLAEVKELNAGYGRDAVYAGTTVPTLGETLDCCRGRINMIIELKSDGSTDKKQLAEKSVQLIKAYEMTGQVVFQSFDYALLTYVKEQKTDIPCGYILEGTIGSYYDLSDADFFSIHMPFVSEKNVERVHLRGKKLLVWTINRKADIQKCKKLGVDCIITDDPIMAREVIYEKSTPGIVDTLGQNNQSRLTPLFSVEEIVYCCRYRRFSDI